MLEEFLQTNVFLLILLFVRVGVAIMIMPGIGDGFVPMRIRLIFSVGLCLVILPALRPILPASVPNPPEFFTMIITEALLGFFIGMVGRILAMALDTAGQIISIQSSLSSAQLFNPSLQSQGSAIGTFLMLSGILLLMVTDMHHMMLAGIVNSYESFPVGDVLDTRSMLDVMLRAVATAFRVGFQISAPLLLVITVLYVGMAVLNRLMPNLQVFMLAMPLQILVSLIIVAGISGFALTYWLNSVQNGIDLYYQVQDSQPLLPGEAANGNSSGAAP